MCWYSVMPSSAATQGSNTSMRQVGPSCLPWRGQVRRSCHGVWMRPMKTSPASFGGGAAIAVSPSRSSFLRTIRRLSVDRDHHVGGLDHRTCRLTDGETELVDGVVG